MKIQRIAIFLTLINLAIFSFFVARSRAVAAAHVPQLLRGRGLEIVDDYGRVRASITVFPPDPTVKMPDGTTGYPETVLLRLINSKGGPTVKLAATEDGSAFLLGGESDPAYVQVLARGTSTSIKLSNKDGRQRVVKP
jgi:hypothetical protein